MPGTCLMKKKHIPIILIVIPALVIVALITFAILRVRAWIYTIQPPAEVYSEKIDAEFGEGSYDVILPLMDENGFAVKQDVKKILVFGNDPFANIPDSGSSMAAMLARKTGADVINCAVSGSLQISGDTFQIDAACSVGQAGLHVIGYLTCRKPAAVGRRKAGRASQGLRKLCIVMIIYTGGFQLTVSLNNDCVSYCRNVFIRIDDQLLTCHMLVAFIRNHASEQMTCPRFTVKR
jgi:hypothetical protein